RSDFASHRRVADSSLEKGEPRLAADSGLGFGRRGAFGLQPVDETSLRRSTHFGGVGADGSTVRLAQTFGLLYFFIGMLATSVAGLAGRRTTRISHIPRHFDLSGRLFCRPHRWI